MRGIAEAMPYVQPISATWRMGPRGLRSPQARLPTKELGNRIMTLDERVAGLQEALVDSCAGLSKSIAALEQAQDKQRVELTARIQTCTQWVRFLTGLACGALVGALVALFF